MRRMRGTLLEYHFLKKTLSTHKPHTLFTPQNMPLALKKSKSNSGAAKVTSMETPKKSFLPKGSKSTAGKVGQSGAVGNNTTPGTKHSSSATKGGNLISLTWGVPEVNDDEFSRRKLLKGFGYKVNGVQAEPITYFNRKKQETQKKIIWDDISFNLQNVPVKYVDPKYKSQDEHTVKFVVSKAIGERLMFRTKTYFRMFWEYTGEGKTLEVYGGADAEGWRSGVVRNFEKVHPSKPMMETLQDFWRSKYPEADLPDSDFDLVWEFRSDPGFYKKIKDNNISTLFAERVKYQQEDDNFLIPVHLKSNHEFLWPHRDEDGKLIKDLVPVSELRRKDCFAQIRIMIRAESTPNGQPSANFSAVLSNPSLTWMLKGKRGELWVPRDQETEEQRAEREAREEKQKAEYLKQCEEAREQQLLAAAEM